jgi:hypothetical protein
MRGTRNQTFAMKAAARALLSFLVEQRGSIG